jgi:hypothetical protein
MSSVEDLREALEYLKDLNLNVQIALSAQHDRVQEILQLSHELLSASGNPLATEMHAAQNAMLQQLQECIAQSESFEDKATQYQQAL